LDLSFCIAYMWHGYLYNRSIMSRIDREKIPSHLRHLEEWKIRALFYLFRGR